MLDLTPQPFAQRLHLVVARRAPLLELDLARHGILAVPHTRDMTPVGGVEVGAATLPDHDDHTAALVEEGRYAIEDYAGDLAGVLDRDGIDRCIVVGHSLGGNVATLFAAKHPGRVEALVLVDTGPALATNALTQISADVGSALGVFGSVDDYAKFLCAPYSLGPPAELARLAEGWLVKRLDGNYEPRLDPGTLGSGLDAEAWARLEAQLWEALASIACPTLVVRGGLSSVLSTSVANEMTHSVLTAGELATLDRAGHAVMIDDLPGLCGALVPFFNRIGGLQPAAG